MPATTANDALGDGPRIRKIGIGTVTGALRAGWADFLARPSHYVFLFIVYPVIGVVLSFVAFNYNLMPLVFPLIAGFALVGPVTAVGVFELSRRREAGEDPPLSAMTSVLHGPSTAGIAQVSLGLFGLFVVWLICAQQIVFATIGTETPAGLGDFIGAVATTEEGRAMFLLGNGVGLIFAIVALAVSVVSLPMLVDGETSALRAVWTSLRAVAANPVPMAAWGVAVAAILAVAMLPAFVGLIVALPWLGHATWHLYRAVVQR